MNGGENGDSETSPNDTTDGNETEETTTEGDETAENETGGNETDGNATEDGAFGDVDGEITDDSDENLEVTERELYESNGEVGLRGTIENVGDTAYEFVEVEVTLQDDQGEVLVEFIDETEEEEIDRLEPGETWEFDVVFEEAQMEEVSSYSIGVDGDLAETTGSDNGTNTTAGNSTSNTTADDSNTTND
ncbi:DUF3426 domain-containing protein [Haloprofundus sp. MHR1]|uniref:DUF3426 domain-containing protein n=1 Tax=Haloprofundus sp. MHR1 TaxID=2572921 RepID=UPI00143D25FF|nr:DUF3426 domain-containing protein [Haloprofundus sp. MHR1]